MTITKNTKIIIGVALLGTAGYLYWKSKQEAAVVCKAGETNKDGKCVATAVTAAPATA